jgi:hypothetical protein
MTLSAVKQNAVYAERCNYVHYAECRCSECRFAECHGAKYLARVLTLSIKLMSQI